MKTYKIKKQKNAKVKEPIIQYGKGEKKIIFFHSFEQQEEYELKQMALLTKAERMKRLEEMRKFFLQKFLLPDGNWVPVARTITIQTPKTK